MPDYGHELQFGAFIRPGARAPEQAVALAEVAEAAGLDLATFQDHPYNPGLLDTWTLLSWVAGPVRMLGEQHCVPEMERGPAPAHAIRIWVGGLKPRMLRLAGRTADGWLPTLGYLPDRRATNRMIDNAAAEAGRDPRESRRLSRR